MHTPDTATPAPARRPRILWANAYCLLDTASGASMAMRELLRQLALAGCEVEILGATVFDHPRGIERLREHWARIVAQPGKLIRLRDAPLTHHLLVTTDTTRKRLMAFEEALWFKHFVALVEGYKPDLILYYGAQVLDLLMTAEARRRGIPVVAFLANGSFSGQRWCQDVDLILTDSRATARRYADTEGLTAVPVGAFVDPQPVLAPSHSRRHVLFVNPSLQKGAALVCLLALLLETRRPDIVFEVVESRGDWPALVKQLSAHFGPPREHLRNVRLTPNTPDMRPIYGRARVLLAPSLWWESFGRVAVEALFNQVPVIHTRSGGLPEVVGEAGICIELPPEAYQPPYTWLPQPEALSALAATLERLFDDEAFYRRYLAKARTQGRRHQPAATLPPLFAALQPLLRRHGVALPVPGDAPTWPAPTPRSAPSPAAPRRVLINSYVGGFGSMGRVGLALLRHLLSHSAHAVSLLPFGNDPMAVHWPEWVARCVDYRPERHEFDQQIKFCSVLEARQRRLARAVTPWFFHDVDGLPAAQVAALDSNDKVLVVSRFVREVFERAGVRVPVEVMGCGFDPEFYRFKARQRGATFNFVCVAEHTPRKNLPMLIRAFERAFSGRDDVRLRIKTGTAHPATALAGLIRDPRRVVLDTQRRSREEDMVALYHAADCFVLPTRLEGFGLPILEAMATGLPVIVTDYSGHLDFCHTDNALLIRSKGLVDADRASFPHLPGRWSEPDPDHLIHWLQRVVADYDWAQQVGRRGHDSVHEQWTWQTQLGRVL